MLRISQLTTVFCGLFLLTAANVYAAAQGYVHDLSGDVQARIGNGKPVTVAKNQVVGNNTTILTGPQSNVILKFSDGTIVALDQNTSFLIQNYNYEEQAPAATSALFSMLRGALRVLTGAISSKNRDSFKLATPVATIGIRGTEFLVQFRSPLITQTITGTTSVTNVAGTTLVGAGQAVSVATATSTAVSLAALPPGTFGNLPGLTMPPATPGGVPGAGAGASGGGAGGAAGGLGGAAVGGAAAVAAAAAAAGSSSSSGTTTGTQ